MKSILLFLALSTAASNAETTPLLFPGAAAPYVQNLGDIRSASTGKGGNDWGNFRNAFSARGVGLVFVPAGNYTINSTTGVNGILRGEGPDKTVIRLNPPSTTGKPGTDKTAFKLAAGTRVEHLTIEVNSSAPEVCGLYIEGGAELVDVVIRSVNGQGSAGIIIGSDDRQEKDSLGAPYAWLKDVKVVGFPIGILARGTATLLTAEHLVLEGQSEAGVKADGACVTLRSMTAKGASPAIVGDEDSLVVVDTAECEGQGGATGKAAIKSLGAVRVRDLKTTGFAKALDLQGAPSESIIQDWSSKDLAVRGGGNGQSIARKEAPVSPEFPFDQWLEVAAADAPDVTTILWGRGQKHPDFSVALQKACGTGKPVVFFRPGQKYGFFGAATIPSSVRVVDGLFGGFFEVFHGSGTRYSGEIVVGDGKESLEIRNLSGKKANLTIRHTGSRPLVLKSVDDFTYEGSDGAGPVFMESCSPFRITLGKGQELQAMSLNMSSGNGPLIVNRGGTARILGLRSNRWTSLVDNQSGAKTEVLGAMVIASTMRPKDPLFVVAPGSTLSASLAEWSVFEVPYERLVCDGSGKVLLKRGEAPIRKGETGSDSERVNGTVLTQLVVGP